MYWSGVEFLWEFMVVLFKMQESDFRKHDTFSLDTSFLTTLHDDIALPRAMKEEVNNTIQSASCVS